MGTVPTLSARHQGMDCSLEGTVGELISREESSGPSILGDLRTLQESVGGTTLATAEELGIELWSIEGDV